MASKWRVVQKWMIFVVNSFNYLLFCWSTQNILSRTHQSRTWSLLYPSSSVKFKITNYYTIHIVTWGLFNSIAHFYVLLYSITPTAAATIATVNYIRCCRRSHHRRSHHHIWIKMIQWAQTTAAPAPPPPPTKKRLNILTHCFIYH